MKCTNCGSENLFETKAYLILFDAGQTNVTTFACENCGHVEFFIYDSILKRHKQDVMRKEEIKKRQEEERRKKEEFDLEIAKLDKIINDENQTVKAVREAQNKKDEMLKGSGCRVKRI